MIPVLAVLSGCGSGPPASLPRSAAQHAPSELVARDGLDPGATRPCAGCHPTHAAEWNDSAHARASFDNPWYRVSVESLREGPGHRASRHCAGCHDPVLLASGAIDGEVDARDPRAVAGVTCLACHAVREVTVDGNASLVLAPVIVPEDPSGVPAHRRSMRTAPLDSPRLCGACHRGFLGPDTGNPHALVGQDDLGAWAASPWAGARAGVLEPPGETKDCRGCHAERAPDGHTSHRFPGAHTGLAVSAEQRDAVRQLLQRAASLSLPGVWVDGQVWSPDELRPGAARVELDVVVRNEGAGHDFPGGQKDTQDIRVQVSVSDAEGAPIAATSDADPACLDAAVLDEDGRRVRDHRTAAFRVPAWDHTVPARQPRVARFSLALPADLAPERWPLRVEVELVHRRHGPDMAAAACAKSLDPDGIALAENAAAQGRAPLDACAPLPATVIARRTVWLGPGGTATDPEEWLDLARGLTLAPTEALGEASRVLDRAEASDDWQRARLAWLRAVVAGRQGRVDDALASVAEAEGRVGPQPALARARGDALARVWRWEEAADAYASAAETAPTDTRTWRELATAAASAGQHDRALAAARRGLSAWPRDPSLLWTQAVALEGRGDDAEAAWEEALRWRAPDNRTQLLLACDAAEPTCASVRAPIPRVALVTPEGGARSEGS